jgi:hypothetical protein
MPQKLKPMTPEFLIAAALLVLFLVGRKKPTILRPVVTHHQPEDMVEIRAMKIAAEILSARNDDDLIDILGYIKRYEMDYADNLKAQWNADDLKEMYDYKYKALYEMAV